MKNLVGERRVSLEHAEGQGYDLARVYAGPKAGGTWQGWIEFVALDGGNTTLRTGRETTQSNLEAVLYWASGLEDVYFEGAFRRALRNLRPAPTPVPAVAAGVVRLSVESLDPVAPSRVMGTRRLSPGMQRRIPGALLVFEGARRTGAGEPPVYDFVAEFGTDNAAARLANALWNDLHGLGATLRIEDVEVAVDHSAIKEAMLHAAVVG